MRTFVIALLATTIVSATGQTARVPQREIDNVAAFTRLYGVVRFFYPSDAADNLDWNGFAVYGVARTRTTRNTDEFATVLRELFNPLGPGIEIAPTRLAPPPSSTGSSGPLVAWRYLGAGFVEPVFGSPYAGKRTHRPRTLSEAIDGVVGLVQNVPARDFQGKGIRIRGKVRGATRAASGGAAIWLRVDRGSSGRGFYDNMGDRLVRGANWREYAVEGTVADDAFNIAFGVQASGSVVADFDELELSVRDAGGNWSPVAIKDSGFEAVAGGNADGWKRVGSSSRAEISRPADHAPEGRQFVRLAPPTVRAPEGELFDDAPPVIGTQVDVDLGSGLKARVPLVLTDAQARGDSAGEDRLAALRSSITSAPGPSDRPGVDARLADVAVAWNAFRHFYPYWTEAGVDWDARLRPQLEAAYVASTRDAEADALRQLVGDARDGHGRVIDTRRRDQTAALPVQLGVIASRVVVTASRVPSDIPVGAVVSTIDGSPAVERVAAAMRLKSGTTQWKQAMAVQEMVTCPGGTIIKVAVETGNGPHEAQLRCDESQPPAEKRPPPITELMPGVWYVDLTRARTTDITPAIEKLASATGVIFDVRGYPTDSGAWILPHLIGAEEGDRWMHVAKIIGPFGQSAGWQNFGWDLKPARPRLSGKIVFLTDGHAISYAESVMGYVADRTLGTIIGSTTAGTNGTIAMFSIPGGFNVTFTGMRVTGHDGQTPHHLVGITPNIPVTPTIAGLREGRDELLERALAFIR
jgi:hypothetical protein